MYKLAEEQDVKVTIEAPSAGPEVLAAVLGSVVLTGAAPVDGPLDDDEDEDIAERGEPPSRD